MSSTRHGLELIEDHPPKVGVVDGADQQDHVEITSHQCDVVDLGDSAQLFAQLPPGVLAYFECHAGGGLQPGLDGVHQGRKLGQDPLTGQPGDAF